MSKKDKIVLLEEAIHSITNKTNRIYFYVANLVNTEGSTGVTYNYAKYLKDSGYDVIMLHDDSKYKKPTFLGNWVNDIKHTPLNKNKVRVSVSDIIIYPETHPDVMEKTKSLNCIKIVLVQAHTRMIGSLLPGVTYRDLDIDYIFTTNESNEKYIRDIFGNFIDVYVIEPSIDDSIFNNKNKYRKPTVAVLARNQKDILKLAKEFYTKNKAYKMLSFRDMRDLTREGFSEVLNESFMAIWIDRDSTFPMFPIECAKTNTPLMGILPDMTSNYPILDSGYFTDTPFDFVNMLTHFFEKYLLDEEILTKDKIEAQKELAKGFKVDDEKDNLLKAISNISNNKKIELEKIYNNIKESENE